MAVAVDRRGADLTVQTKQVICPLSRRVFRPRFYCFHALCESHSTKCRLSNTVLSRHQRAMSV